MVVIRRVETQQPQVPGQCPEMNVENKPWLADRRCRRLRRVDIDDITVLNPMAVWAGTR